MFWALVCIYIKILFLYAKFKRDVSFLSSVVIKLTLLLWLLAFPIMSFKTDLFREAFCGAQGGYSVNLYLIKVSDIVTRNCKRADMRNMVYTSPHLFLGHFDASSEVILKCCMSIFPTFEISHTPVSTRLTHFCPAKPLWWLVGNHSLHQPQEL